ncbi:MAG: HEAT repeat domain-containing protein [Verrucomicrobiota bacterium]|jgi:HEAT repeat protein
MKKQIKHISVGVVIGLLILTGAAWLLSKSLGNFHEPLYAGQSLDYWRQQLDGRDTGASNKAYAVVNTQVIPQLLDTLFHDTNDSKVRLAAIDVLDGLPGIRVNFMDARERQSCAAGSLGDLGPAAQSAVPALIEGLNGEDSRLHEHVISALGRIHSKPDVVIPILISFLTNDDLNDEAATALANYGSLAKVAVPKIIPLLKARDKEARAAARAALKQIDPIAAAKAGIN